MRSSPSPLPSSDVPDRILFERLRTGDPAAFEALFRAHAPTLVAFARSYVDSTAVAEELVQDLFCRLWDQRFEATVPDSVRAYLFASLRNRALNHLRREQTSLDFASHAARLTSRTAAADDAVLTKDLGAALTTAVRGMPMRCREVFTLVRDQQLSYAEVAELLGISKKTVEIHMSRALVILREKLRGWTTG
jgi:RNA polymerase sigma-70 factor (ECF subfamily)